MTYEALFNFLSYAPGPFWLCLMICPKNKIAMRAFDVFLFILSVSFTFLTLPEVPTLLPIIASPTFDSIRAVLSTPQGFVGSWNHMILSDLWIGRWIIHDSLSQGVASPLRLAILLITLFFGPVGLCFYLVYRFVFLKKLALTDS